MLVYVLAITKGHIVLANNAKSGQTALVHSKPQLIEFSNFHFLDWPGLMKEKCWSDSMDVQAELSLSRLHQL